MLKFIVNKIQKNKNEKKNIYEINLKEEEKQISYNIEHPFKKLK